MIFQLLSKEEVVQLKDDLHNDLPGSAKMFYVLSNFLRGLLEGFELIVDHWPQWTCAILRPHRPDAVPDCQLRSQALNHQTVDRLLDRVSKEDPHADLPYDQEQVASYFRHYYICHTKSVKAFRFFIRRPCVVDWTKPACLTGVPYDAVPTLQEQCRKHGGRLSSVENRFMYAWTNRDPPQRPPVPDGLTLTTLRPQDAAVLCEHWSHYRPDPAVDKYMHEVTDRFDSSAITNEEGELVAFIGMQFNGAMAMMHVQPRYRGRGLGHLVLADLTCKLLSKKKTAFGLIPTEDTSFIATSSQKLGFTWVPQGSMAWIRYQPMSPRGVRRTAVPRPSIIKHPSSLTVSTACEKEGEEAEDKRVLYLNALPLSCNDFTDVSSNNLPGVYRYVRVGIS